MLLIKHGNLLPQYRSAFCTLLILIVSTSAATNNPGARSPPSNANKASIYEAEYRDLHATTDDKDGLESIRTLHEQLDDDNDGTIEPSETGDFIREDLQYRGTNDRHQQQMRQKRFHGQDTEITVKDLWDVWFQSEVHNWTVDQTVEWLVKNVGLPQYEQNFRIQQVTGARLPQVAVGSSYLTKMIGVTNPIHRSKLSLKAMDVVLFGPPKEPTSTVKDIILTSLLVIAISGLAYAYRQNKKSQEHLKKMMSDMEGLSKAEETLKDLQEKLVQRDEKLESLELTHHQNETTDVTSTMEVSRLKEEVEVLRNELHRAEIELEDRCWVAPTVLQHWLQLTYELESLTYNGKKKAAEQQLEAAKEMCEKLKRKRMSLVGAFVSTHGGSIDDVDRSILEAKTALLEVTQDLTERTQRWRQIEALCGCTIVTNPGVTQLQKIVRHVGIGRLPGGGSRGGRMSTSLSQDDLMALDDNTDAISVAASSSHMTSSSSHASRPHGVSTPSKIRRAAVLTGKVGSSKESTSSSDDIQDYRLAGVDFHAPPSSVASPPAAAATASSLSKLPVKLGSSHQDLQQSSPPISAASDVFKTINSENGSTSGTKLGEDSLVKPINEIIITESEPRISAASSLSSLIPQEPPVTSSMASLNASLKVRDEDTESIASDISNTSKVTTATTASMLSTTTKKKKTFFSFGRRKEKQKDII